MRIACIDVGTNSARLLIADVGGPRNLRTIAHFQRTIRLGEGVDANGMINSSAMDRLVDTLEQYSAQAAQYNASRIVVAGTSASRDSQEDLAQAVYNRTGLTYEILSGRQEAKWSFRGAMSSLPHITGPALSCDIGGGSTEVTLGYGDGRIRREWSLDLGSVRITERYFSSQPPTHKEVSRARAFIQDQLTASGLSRKPAVPLIGASDTHRILVHLVGHHPQRLLIEDAEAWQNRLLDMTRQEVRALEPEHLKGRDDIFPAAALICHEVMAHLRCEHLTMSRRDLAHGLAIREHSRSRKEQVGAVNESA